VSVKSVLTHGVSAFGGMTLGYLLSRAQQARLATIKPREPSKQKPAITWKRVTFLTTWEERCGIAVYSKNLLNALREVRPAECEVVRISRTTKPEVEAQLLHWQFEYGIAPFDIPKAFDNVMAITTVVTMHGVSPVLPLVNVDVVADAYFVHNKPQFEVLKGATQKPIYLVPHGAVVFNPIDREKARSKLGLPARKKIIYIHGIGEGKHYDDVIEILPKLGKDVVVVCLASSIEKRLAEATVKSNIDRARKIAKREGVEEQVLFVGRWISEEEINLYVSACDALLFNYKTPPELIVSASGAVKRVISAGKPIVCSRGDPRLWDLDEDVHCIRYDQGDLGGMLSCLGTVLSDTELAEWLGQNCRILAFKLSWRNVAVRHLEIYDELWVKARG